MTMNEVQGGRWDESIRRLFGMKEPKVSPVIAPEIVPVATIQPHDPEMYYLRREYLGSAIVTPPAVAGNYAYASLVMPADARALVVVEEIRMWAADANQHEFWIGWDSTGAAGTPAVSGYRDSRVGTVPANAITIPTCFYGASAAPGPMVNFAHVNCPIRAEAIYPHPVILGANADLMVQISDVNVSFYCLFTFRERSGEATEVGTR